MCVMLESVKFLPKLGECSTKPVTKNNVDEKRKETSNVLASEKGLSCKISFCRLSVSAILKKVLGGHKMYHKLLHPHSLIDTINY